MSSTPPPPPSPPDLTVFCVEKPPGYQKRVETAEKFDAFMARIARQAVSSSLPALRRMERTLLHCIPNITGSRAGAFLQGVLRFIVAQREALERRELFVQAHARAELTSVVAGFDIPRWLDENPVVPMLGNNYLAPFSSGEHMFVQVSDWSFFPREQAFFHLFLDSVDKSLVQKLELDVGEMPPHADYGVFNQVLPTWRNLDELGVRISALAGANVWDTALENVLLACDPPRVVMLGEASLLRCDALARLTRVEYVAMHACDDSPTIAAMGPNIRSLPGTVRELSLGVYRPDTGTDHQRTRKMLEELSALLDLIPPHVNNLEVIGFKVFESLDVVQKIFPSNRFVEVGLFHTENTELQRIPCTQAEVLRFRALAQAFSDTASVETLRVDKLSTHVCLFLEKGSARHVTTTIPITAGGRDFDRERAQFAFMSSEIPFMRHVGLPTHYPPTVDLQQSALKRQPEADQRYRCILFCLEQLAPNAHKHIVPSLGAVPVCLLKGVAEFASVLTVDKNREAYLTTLACRYKYRALHCICLETGFFGADLQKKELLLKVGEFIGNGCYEIDYRKAVGFICDLMRQHDPDAFKKVDAEFYRVHFPTGSRENERRKRALDEASDSPSPLKQLRP